MELEISKTDSDNYSDIPSSLKDKILNDEFEEFSPINLFKKNFNADESLNIVKKSQEIRKQVKEDLE